MSIDIGTLFYKRNKLTGRLAPMFTSHPAGINSSKYQSALRDELFLGGVESDINLYSIPHPSMKTERLRLTQIQT